MLSIVREGRGGGDRQGRRFHPHNSKGGNSYSQTATESLSQFDWSRAGGAGRGGAERGGVLLWIRQGTDCREHDGAGRRGAARAAAKKAAETNLARPVDVALRMGYDVSDARSR